MATICCGQVFGATVSPQLEILHIENVSTSWQTVPLDNTYANAIPVCTYNLGTFAGSNPSYTNPPAVPRIRNITSNSFDLRIQGWEDASASAGDVHCIVAETGAHTLPDGREFEARSVLSVNTVGQYATDGGWNQALLEDVSTLVTGSYASPVVLGQVLSFNDSRASVIYVSDCDDRGNRPFHSGMSDGMCVGNHIGMIAGDRSAETIGFIVAEAGSGTVNNVQYELAQGADQVAGNNGSDSGYTYSLSGDHNFGVLTQAGEDGGNGSWAVLYSADPLPANQLKLAVDEEIFAGDTTRNHTNEPVDYWVFTAAELTLVNNVINDNGGSRGADDFGLTIDGVAALSGTPYPILPGATVQISEVLANGYTAGTWSCSDANGLATGLPTAGNPVATTLSLPVGADVTCEITNNDIAPTLTLVKQVVNDNGGTLSVTDFDLFVDAASVVSGVSGQVDANTAIVISESVHPGYAQAGWSCVDLNGFSSGLPAAGAAAGETITLAEGADVTCSITNNDIAPTLTLSKTVLNDDGGNLAVDDFDISIDGTQVDNGTATTVAANASVTISELEHPGYTEGTWSCSDAEGITAGLPASGAAGGTALSLLPGSVVTCSISNDDIAPTLTLVKNLTNDDGGLLAATDFDLSIDGSVVTSGVAQAVLANSAIVISELDLPGYTTGVWSCTDSNGLTTGLPASGAATAATVMLAAGAAVVCEIANNDIAPTLTLEKTVVNDDGGDLLVGDFTLNIDGSSVSSGVINTVTANSVIEIGELAQPGYMVGSWSCTDSAGLTSGLPTAGDALSTSISLMPGSVVNCAIQNDDIAPTVSLVGSVVNDNGGTLAADDFDLTVDGSVVSSGSVTTVAANSAFTIGELDLPGYTEGSWSCTDASGLTTGLPTAGSPASTSLTLAAGSVVTCEISNDDIAPTLSLNKTVVNDNGGSLVVEDFDIAIDGIEVSGGAALSVQANATITISELDLPGYTEGSWSCTDTSGLTSGLPSAGASGGTDLTLQPGSVVNCAISNDDIAPTLTLLKTVINDNGGALAVDDFDVSVDGVEIISGVANTVTANSPVVISELVLPGYTEGSWSCTDAAGVTTGLPGSGAAAATTVTLLPGADVTCAITNNDIAPSLTLTKSVSNDDGGDATVADFTLLLDGTAVTSGVSQAVEANTSLVISELSEPGYVAGSWSCVDSAGLTTGLPTSGAAAGTPVNLAPGAEVSCEIVNNDVPPELTLIKSVVNDNGGLLSIGDFDLTIDGVNTASGATVTVAANSNIVIAELPEAGYLSGTWSCVDANGLTSGLPTAGAAAGETITLAEGADVTCSIANNDIAPSLTLSKTLINDNGGARSLEDFDISIDGVEVASGVAAAVQANTPINISELDLPGYSEGSWSCSDASGLTGGLPSAGAADSTDITLSPGADVTCAITNDDIAPTLTLNKTVLNDNGGALTASDFNLSIDGAGVSHGVSNEVQANTAIVISELNLPGYIEGTWFCSDSTGLTTGLPGAGDALSTSLNLMPGSEVSCSITNDDVAPLLTLVKTVVNDHGGNLSVADFDISIDGVEVLSGVATAVQANTSIIISELDVDGYTEGSWSCNDAAGITTGLPTSGAATATTLNLLPGSDVTCAISNDDIAPSLTLVSNVLNDNGGTLGAAEFDPSIDGAEVLSGIAESVIANTTIDIGELDLPGYAEGSWSCNDASGLTAGLPSSGAAGSTSVTLAAGAVVTCSIDNDDIAPTLTLNKTLTNDNGGNLTIDDFDISIDGIEVVSGVATTVTANSAMVISELDLAGYTGGSWSCNDANGITAGLPAGGLATSTSLTLLPGSQVTCAISNNDIAPTLTLNKSLTNDNGGSKSIADFDISIDGSEVISGIATTVIANTTLTISELDLPGYTAGTWSCIDVNGVTTGLPAAGLATATDLNLLPGSAVSCSISNDDIAPALTLFKTVTNDDGGNRTAADFNPSIDGVEVISGAAQSVQANTLITISELTLPGYSAGSWSCVDASGLTTGLPTAGDATSTTLTLTEGAVVSCTIENDDIAPTLALNTTVINDNGGSLSVSDFDIAINGTEVDSGDSNAVLGNSVISISELDLPGYAEGTWSCSDAAGLTPGLPAAGIASGTDLTLLPGSVVTCAISNDDIAPTLTLNKTLINDNGGELAIGDFDISIDGTEVVSGIATTVDANTDIEISELIVDGYSTGAWSCADTTGLTSALPASGAATGTIINLMPGSIVSCDIANNDIAPTLTLTTTLINDNGGSLTIDDFDISIDGSEVGNGVSNVVAANTLVTISELDLPGYTEGAWFCSDATGLTTGLPVAGSATATDITLQPGSDVTCAITNNDIAPTLTLTKTLINDDGGSLLVDDFDIAIDGAEVASGVVNTVVANSVVTISELVLPGYSEGEWFCSDASGLTTGLPVAGAATGTDLTLVPGAVVSCVISNDDIAPTLTLVKTLINNDGGDLVIGDFDIAIDGIEVVSGVATPVAANSDIVISELILDGYTEGSWSCSDAAGLTAGLPVSGGAAITTVNLKPGSSVTCAISNDDIAPTLTLTKTLINDNGGNLSIDDFDLSIDGAEVDSGVSKAVLANTTITISELDLPGYSEGSWACVDASGLTTGLPTVGDPIATDITLLPGADVSCEITNNDIPPTLTLIKTLTNDNGGDLSIADFDLSIDGTEVTSGAVNTVMSNSVITISELALPGYTTGSWSCSDATGYTSGLPASGAATGTDITLAAGAVVSCEISNDDIAPQLTLSKIVTNDNGGNAVIGDFALQIDGGTVVSGNAQVVQANADLVISELAVPGYTQGTWSCTDSTGLSTGLPTAGAASGTTLKLLPGSNVNCGVINNDVAPMLTLVKTVVNDNGGNLLADDFDISIDGTEVDSGVAITVAANTAIVISELEIDGYSSGSWSCTDASGYTGGLPSAGDASATTVTLSEGAEVTCSITNNDSAPTLTLVKTLINDDGGSLAIDDFDIAIDGTEVISGVSTVVTANSPVTISELDLPGYSEGTWSCSDAAGLTSGLPTAGTAALTEVTLLPGSDVTCSISNNDIAPLLTLNKSVVNDNGGDLTVADFDIAIDGLEVVSGDGTTVNANTDIVISELVVDGYAAGSWSCSDSTGLTSGLPAAGSAESTTLNLLPGSVVSCSITNDDIAPTLTLVKTLLNDNGGSLAIDDFDLAIDWVVVDSGVTSTVQANSTIAISELDLAGYTEGAWLCSDANGITTGLPIAGSAAGTSLTLLPGSDVSCSIINNDIGPTLTLLPSVVNDNGGSLLAADFEPAIDGAEVISGVAEAVLANTLITISELDLPGYSEGSWSCVDGNGLTVGLPTAGNAISTTLTLAEGSAVVCSIVNDDIAPSLSLSKTLINDDGGDLSVDDFDIAVDGVEVDSGVATVVTANTDILISELAVDGYSAGQWSCTDASGITTGLPASGSAIGTTVNLKPGAVVDCGITNNDIAPTLTLIKTVINDNGGDLAIDDFVLSIDGAAVGSGVSHTVAANSLMTIGEAALPGYVAGVWSCTDSNGLSSGLPSAGSASATDLILKPGSAVSCAITNNDIAPLLTLTKTVDNSDGGDLDADDFTLLIDSTAVVSGSSNAVSANTALTISEISVDGYTPGTWNCSDANGLTVGLPGGGDALGTVVNLAPGSDVSCAISNNDIAPTLTLVNAVTNDEGGALTADDFDLNIDGTIVLSGAVNTVAANSSITIGQLLLPGYAAAGWQCSDANGLTGSLPLAGNAVSTPLVLSAGSIVTCSIVNDDIAPTLTLDKTLINDDGGNLTIDDFDIAIDGIETGSGVSNIVSANTELTISELELPGYVAGSWSCSDASGLTTGLPGAGAATGTDLSLEPGSDVTCAISNNDISPTLTLTKSVINDNGGELTVDDFDISIDGSEVTSGVANEVTANIDIVISELDITGYSAGSWFCEDSTGLTSGLPASGDAMSTALNIKPGSVVSCSIVNNDIAPTLTLTKTVINDHGGLLTASDFDPSIDGVEIISGDVNAVDANAPIEISEQLIDGYAAGQWSCVDTAAITTGLPVNGDATGTTITLLPGSEVNCSIANDDIGPTLTLVKNVVNDNGGQLTQADFDPAIDGVEVTSGNAVAVDANKTVTISELAVPGYTSGVWSCVDASSLTAVLPDAGPAVGTDVTLVAGAAVTCEITNNDIAPLLTLVKSVINDNGGALVPDDFELSIDGTEVASGSVQVITANTPVIISELVLPGYTAGAWSCTDANGLASGLPSAGAADATTLNIPPGADVTCSITNNDVAPTLTLVSAAINDNGGELLPDDFGLSLDGTTVLSGAVTPVAANTAISISEIDHPGYVEGQWSCVDASGLTSGLPSNGAPTGTVLNLPPGASVICEITNNDIAPTLTLDKTVINDSGGLLSAVDFGLSVDGTVISDGVAISVDAHADITISELDLPGYQEGSWSCVDDSGLTSGLPVNGAASGTTISLLPGSVVTCSISNNDIAPMLTLSKQLTNDNGGTKSVADFELSVDGAVATVDIAQPVLANTPIVISELDLPGYTSGTWSCVDSSGLTSGLPTSGAAAGEAIMLASGAVVTCEIANDDQAPALTLIKTLINDNGGNLLVSDFGLSMDDVAVSDSVAYPVAANTSIKISELEVPGYTSGTWSCVDNNGLTTGLPSAGTPTNTLVTLAEGADVSCTISNDDIAPTLTLNKTVITDDGGNEVAADFELFIDGAEVAVSVANTVLANTGIVISESAHPGYSAGTWSCVDSSGITTALPAGGAADNTTISLLSGSQVSCDITNDDLPATLTLNKAVQNDAGGDLAVSDFELMIDGVRVDSGVAQIVAANVLVTISEASVVGYESGVWSCIDTNGVTTGLPAAGAADGAVLTLAEGAAVVCEITNTDISPTLTLNASVVNDDGGQQTVAALNLAIDGVLADSGVSYPVTANTVITIAETPLDGYLAGAWSCVDTSGLPTALPSAGAAAGADITLKPGSEVVCEITNDDIAPQLTLQKTLVNDDGGTSTIDDFDLSIDGVEVPTGIAHSLIANTAIVISEADLPGYIEGSWVCADSTGFSTGLPTAGLATGETISLAPGAVVNCGITNDDFSASLTLLSNVTNDNGGSAVPDDFGLTLDGAVVASGAASAVNVNTLFDIGELDLPGYSEGVWSCTDSTGFTTGLPVAGAAGSTSVTLAGGAQVTCEITNNDIAPSLTLIKNVVNNNGGVLTGADFDLTLDGSAVTGGIANPVMANTTITIAEVAVAGYASGSWNCIDANSLATGLPVAGGASGTTLSLPSGAAVTCEITNDDIPPTLTLVSNVLNDHGGLLGSGDFAPSIDGVEVANASLQTVTANTSISIGELDVPGYAEGSWSCIDANGLSSGLLTAGIATGDTVSLVPGADVTCTIINDDIAPTLTLVKTVINDNGGGLAVDDFGLSIDGVTAPDGVAQTVDANTPVVISELLVPGYNNGSWVCSDSTSLTASLPTAGDATGTTLSLKPGSVVTCAIENNDIAPLLTLVKTVNNDNGGNKTVADFELSIDGSSVVSGATNTVAANTAFEIRELNLPAYAEGSWSCVDANGLTGGLPDSGNATGTLLTLVPGSDVTCSITNNDLGIDLSIVKTVDDSTPEIGEAVAFTLSIKNAGPDTASDIVVTDPLPAGFSYVAGSISGGDTQIDTDLDGSGLQWIINSLSAGEDQTLSFNANVNASPMTTAAMTNIATVAANDDQFESVTSNNTASVLVQPKGLALKKLADASGVSTPSAAGDIINYSITAANTGLLPLTDVTLTDSIIASAQLSLTGDTDNNGQIDTGEIWQWQGSYALTQADLDSNGGGDAEINNVVLFASAELADQTAEVAVPITTIADFTVSKLADAAQIAVPGAVAYTIEISNTGNVSLNNVQPVDTLPDGTIAVLTGPVADTGDNAVLDVGETWVFNASYEATQADIDAGVVLENTVSVSTDETGTQNKIATAQTAISNSPEFRLSKEVNAASVSTPAVLSYTIELENTGNTTLTDITLLDTLPDGSVANVTGPDADTGITGVIDVGETWRYSTTYSVSQADIDAGMDLVNRVEVTTLETGTTAVADEAVTSVTATPAFAVEKLVDQPSISAPGVLNYTISVENTGNVSLDGIALSDLLPDGSAASLTGPVNDSDDQGVLNVGEIWQYTASYTVLQTDIDAAIDLVNQVTVSSNQTGAFQQTAAAVTTVAPEPDITVSKTVDIASVDVPTLLSYEIVVENTGNLSLSNLLVSDILPDGTQAVLTGPIDDTGFAGVLDVGESWRFTTGYTVTQTDIDLGLPRTNTVSVTSDETTDAVFTASAVTTIDSRPTFTVDKTVDVTELAAPGTLNYEILIANTGNTSLSGIDVSDTMPDGSVVVLTEPTGDGGIAGVLDVGEVWTYTTQYPVSQSVIDNGVALVNAVTVKTTEAGAASDTVTTTVSQTPSLSIVKSTDTIAYQQPGDVIAYALLVSNTGNLILDNVLVTDALADPASVICEQSMPFTLSPAGSVQCEATITVTATHVSELGIDNTASVTATDPMGSTIEAQSALVSVAMNLLAPVAVDDSDSASVSGATITLQPLANDTDGNGDLLNTTLSLQSADAIDTNDDGFADTLIVDGEGQWLVDNALGTVSFTPEPGFTADPSPVLYVVSDATDLVSNVATLTIDYPQNAPTAIDDHKNNPAPPAPENPTTVNVIADNGNGADTDSEGDLDISSVSFVIGAAVDSDEDGDQDTLVVAGEGTWSVNNQALVTFTPEAGFFGDPTPVQYTISDNNGLVSNAATITIDYPQSTPLATNDSLFDQPLQQAVTLSVVDNDTDPESNIDPASVRIIEPETGAAVLSLTVADEGLWAVDGQTGDISFTPAPDFLSSPTPIGYQVSDTTALTSNVAIVTVTYEEPAILQGTVWLDRDSDGEIGVNENRKPGWTLIVRDDEGNVVATTVTDANGDYIIKGLVPAVYTVEFYNEVMVFMDALSTGTAVLAGQTVNLPLPVDPSGVVYDSVSRLPVAGVQLFLLNGQGLTVDESCVMENQQGQVTEADGLYAFDIIPGADSSCGPSEEYRIEPGEMPADYHQRFSTIINNEIAAACDVADPNCSINTFDSAPTEAGCTIDTIPDSGACEIQQQASAPAQDQDTRYYLTFRIETGDTNVIHNHLPVDAVANDAELLLSKTVNKSQVSVGGQLQYLIAVENLKEVEASDIQIHDFPPAGFKIDRQSVRLIRAGEDATFDTEDDVVAWLSLTGTADITFQTFALGALETARIRYSMKVGTGVVNGNHHNRATATGPNGMAVNTVSAAVTVIDDPVLAQATLIGKVFIDRDEDGSQDPAHASGVVVRSSYFGPSGLTLPDLPARKRLGEDPSDKAFTINLPLDRNREFVISTDQGTYIEVDIDGRTTERHRGEIARGLNGQNINVCTHQTTGLPVLADGTIGEQEVDVIQITLTNHGVEEQGIPGVRLASVNGLIVETDGFGRFNVPDVVAARGGRNFILKVDPATLPADATFTTENPQVMRMVSESLNRMNFGVILPEEDKFARSAHRCQHEVAASYKTVEVKLGSVFFDVGSAEVREDQQGIVFDIGRKLRDFGGGEIIVQAHADSAGNHQKNIALAERRADSIRRMLMQSLGRRVMEQVVVRVDPEAYGESGQ